jgi:RNA polymerase sigma-70 factor, ECF subfamily
MTPQQAEELATLWTASQRVVAAFIRTLVPDFSEADDILQRVAVALVRKFDDYDSSRPFAAWAIGMAKWEVLAYRRERALDRHVFFAEGLIDRIADSYRHLSEERSPKREMLAKCFDRLDTRAREAIDLRYAKNLRTLEIAQEMQMSDSAVRKLLSRARVSLRDCVDRRLDESGDGA